MFRIKEVKSWGRLYLEINFIQNKLVLIYIIAIQWNILGARLKMILESQAKNAKNWVNWHNTRWLGTVGESVRVGRIPTKKEGLCN